MCMSADIKPTIIVMVGKEIIKSSTSSIDIKPTLPKDLFKIAFGQPSKNIKYIKPGRKITINFANNPPDKISMKNSVLNSNGEIMYTERETMDVPLSKANNEYYFNVQTHMASLYNCSYDTNRKDFIGYVAEMTWGEISYVSVFVIKTDA